VPADGLSAYNPVMNSAKFKAACATGEDWQSITGQCLADLGPEPSAANLGLIYLTEPLAPYLQNMLDFLQADRAIGPLPAKYA